MSSVLIKIFLDGYIIEYPVEDFHTTGARTLKERLAHTVLVLGTAINEQVDDMSDVLDAVTRLEMRLFEYDGDAMNRTLNVRTASF